MTTIADIRKKYPQYDDMSDDQLADAFHKKFYSDMSKDEFDKKIGLTPALDKDTQARLKGDEGEYTAFGQNFANGVPIVGPWLKERYLDADAWLDRHLPTSMVGRDTTGQTQEEARKYSENAGRTSEEYHPWAATAGELSGAAAGTGAMMALPGGAVAMGARSIPGLTGAASVATRMGLGAASGAGIGAADAAARGENVAKGAGIGGAFGAAGPLVADVAGPLLQKGLSKLNLAPSRPGGRELYTAAKEFKDIRSKAEVPNSIRGRVYPEGQKYEDRIMPSVPSHQGSQLAEVNRIARTPGPGRDVVRDYYRNEASKAGKEVNDLADHWFPTQVDSTTGALKTIDPKRQTFRDKLLDFGDEHDKAFDYFGKQANYRKLQETLGEDNAHEFMEHLWNPANVADANRGIQRSLGVGLNKDAASKITKRAPVEIGGPQTIPNRLLNGIRHAAVSVQEGRRPVIDEHLANLLLNQKLTVGGKTYTGGELLKQIDKSVKAGQLPANEARKLIVSLMQSVGSNENSSVAETGILGTLQLGRMGQRGGGAVVDFINPFN